MFLAQFKRLITGETLFHVLSAAMDKGGPIINLFAGKFDPPASLALDGDALIASGAAASIASGAAASVASGAAAAPAAVVNTGAQAYPAATTAAARKAAAEAAETAAVNARLAETHDMLLAQRVRRTRSLV